MIVFGSGSCGCVDDFYWTLGRAKGLMENSIYEFGLPFPSGSFAGLKEGFFVQKRGLNEYD